MKVLVIGAAGRTGRAVVERALAAGHLVTAFVRNIEEYERSDVRVMVGDAADQASINTAMAGQEAVIDTIGGKTPYRKTSLERSVAGTVVAAMKAEGTNRVIIVSSFGVGDSGNQVSWFVEHVIVPTWLRGSTEDKTATKTIIRASGIAFVIVRPAILNDRAATGKVTVFHGHDTAHTVTREDVAQFCVDQLTSNQYIGSAVTIANA